MQIRHRPALPLVLLCAACAAPPPPAGDGETRTRASYEAWRASTTAPVAAFEGELAAAGLAGLVPMHELLRSASDWAPCKASPYDIPPPAQWADVRSVLSLLKALREQGVLNRIEVYSTYRNEALNACAQGAKGSAHLRAYALDFRPLDDEAAGQRLCQFWQVWGKTWRMGLSRYPSGRIHIDTHGWRTWGADHSGKTAFCTALPATTAASTP
ncbi:MAG TPA: D-Ala-D-Ala carboxypeptidase family metallohydrolase [Burkholderiaceae bacterium]